MFRLGYNTNGLSHHRVCDALRLLAEMGYEGVALTPDAGQLDPLNLDPRQVAEVRRLARDLGLELALESGSRFLLDPRRKHFPTLLEDSAAERARRVDFLRRCIDLAAELGAPVVSFWAGAGPRAEVADGSTRGGVSEGAVPTSAAECEPLWDRLCAGTSALIEHARTAGVKLAFEPEPGMFLSRPAGYDELAKRLGVLGQELWLCLDVGHCLCTGDLPVVDVIRRYATRLAQVHLDDIQDGRHEHLMFGRGTLDLREVLRALSRSGYTGMAAVELSRDSHRGAEAAREALGHLRAASSGLA